MAWYCQQRGHADTLWYPQFFSAATLESKCFTADSATADPSDGRRHGDVRIGEPGDPTLRFSSRLLCVHNVFFPGIPSLSSGLGFRRDRQGRYLVSLERFRSFVQHPVCLPTALEEMRGGTSPARPQQCKHPCWRCLHTLASSVLPCSHFESQLFDEEKHPWSISQPPVLPL